MLRLRNQESESTQLRVTWVLLLRLLSRNIDDQLRLIFHWFVILCINVEIHQVGLLDLTITSIQGRYDGTSLLKIAITPSRKQKQKQKQR